MWVGTQIEAQYKETRDTLDSIMSNKERIQNHFGDQLDGTWLQQYDLTDLFFIKTGVQPIIDIGYCEYCENCKGVTPERRRIKNISVLNSYCFIRTGAVRPDFRCCRFGPKQFYADVMVLKFQNIIINKKLTDLNWWLTREDKPREEYY